MNWRQLFDIGVTEEGLAGRREVEEEEVQEEEPAVPQFNPRPSNTSPLGPSHSYNLWKRPFSLLHGSGMEEWILPLLLWSLISNVILERVLKPYVILSSTRVVGGG